VERVVEKPVVVEKIVERVVNVEVPVVVPEKNTPVDTVQEPAASNQGREPAKNTKKRKEAHVVSQDRPEEPIVRRKPVKEPVRANNVMEHELLSESEASEEVSPKPKKKTKATAQKRAKKAQEKPLETISKKEVDDADVEQLCSGRDTLYRQETSFQKRNQVAYRKVDR
jgi:hypothetical protein